jgi:hypothetical protein
MLAGVLIGAGLFSVGIALRVSRPDRDLNSVYIIVILVGIMAIFASLSNLLAKRGSTRIRSFVVLDDPERDDISSPSPELQDWLGLSATTAASYLSFVRKAGGRLLILVGAVLAMLGTGTMAIVLRGEMPRELGQFGRFFFVAIGCLAGFAGLSIVRWGRGLKTPSAAEILRVDRRRPALLLRSFSDDSAPLRQDQAIMMNAWSLKSLNTLEDMIVAVFQRSGPVIAVGRPGEAIPPSGASRAWISNSDWQKRVQDLLEWSRFVVMVLGDPQGQDGLAWEIQQVFSLRSPQKLILVVPVQLDEGVILGRWRKYDALAGGRMPPYQTDIVSVRFGPDWSAKVNRVEGIRELEADKRFERFGLTLTSSITVVVPARGPAAGHSTS